MHSLLPINWAITYSYYKDLNSITYIYYNFTATFPFLHMADGGSKLQTLVAGDESQNVSGCKKPVKSAL